MPIFDPASLERYAAQAQSPPALTAPAPKKPSVLWPMIATAGGNVADTLATQQALGSGRAIEGNPALPNHYGAITAIKALITLPELLGEQWLNNHGHDRLAKIMGYGIGGFGAVNALHNMQVGK